MAWKRLNVAPVFKKSRDYPSCYRLVEKKRVLLEAISGHMEEKNVTRKIHHGFTKGNH